MKQRIFVISDTEMGKKDVMDDFTDDDLLFEFITNLKPQNPEEKIVLVLNGDIFDFLKMAYKSNYPRYITEEISLWKMAKVIDRHPKFFAALKKFLKTPRAEIYFIIGNHDFDLVWPKVQKKIHTLLGNNTLVHFRHHFATKELWVEHGNSLDPFFDFNTRKPIIHYRNQKILNLPLGCYLICSYLAPFKRKFPLEEKMYPKEEVIQKSPLYRREIKKMMFRFLWKGMIFDPIIHWNDPTYRIPYKSIILHIFYHGFDFTNDEKFLFWRASKLFTKHIFKKLYVLGHTHILTDRSYGSKRLLVTDTWRDEFTLKNGHQTIKPRTYAEITTDHGKIVTADLKIYSKLLSSAELSFQLPS